MLTLWKDSSKRLVFLLRLLEREKKHMMGKEVILFSSDMKLKSEGAAKYAIEWWWLFLLNDLFCRLLGIARGNKI